MNGVVPSIHFTTTSDGVEIGFWEIGAGPPLLVAQNRSLSHAELEWEVPSFAALYRELARYFRLVRFDPRGSGISGEPTDVGVTLDALALDIAAVVAALDVESFGLVGAISLGPSTLRHVVSRPEGITHLILCDTGPNLSDLPLNAYVKATDALVDLGVVPSLGALFPSTLTDDLPALERLMRGSLYERPRVRPRDLSQFDVSEELDRVTPPTLVVRSRDSVYTDAAQTRRLLVGIPDAELVVVPGTMAPWLADLDSVVEAFVSFMTSGHHRSKSPSVGAVLTVVFTDLVSSTEALNRMGDLQGRRAISEIEDLVSELSTRYGGRLVKKLGDGSLLTFTSTRQAIGFSLDLQGHMSDRVFDMRIGMAAGEPIQEEGDIHGAVVAQASRIADLGGAGEVVVSDSVRQLAVGKGFEFELKGEIHLKGFDEPQRVWNAHSRRPLPNPV